MPTNNISTCLWFDDQGEEAANFYTSIFDHAKITTTTYHTVESPSQKPMGDVLTVGFEIEGFSFLALNGGPHFKKNPSISFILNFDPSKEENADEHLEQIWHRLMDGGTALMKLGKYPFSPKYGWVQDQYGVTWQLMLTNPEGEYRPFITPNLMFAGSNTNHAEEALNFYLSVFKEGKQGNLAPYPVPTGPAKKGSLMYGDFQIKNTWLAVMDCGVEQDLDFNEGVSIMVHCDTQEEIDYYWKRLSAVPEAEQCGWLKDKYGVSWQIVPNLEEIIAINRSKKAMQAMMQMKKLDIRTLKKAGNE